MPHPVNPDLGFKIEKAIIQMKETIRKRPTKPQQILQNSQPNFLAFLFKSVIPAFANSSFRKAKFCRTDSLNFCLREAYSWSLKNVSMSEKGAGSPSNNLVLVSHWYFEEASRALVVDRCTINAFATTWGGTINGIPVWWASCFSLVATALSCRRVICTVKRRNCNLFPTRYSCKRAAMLAFPQLSQRYARSKARWTIWIVTRLSRNAKRLLCRGVQELPPPHLIFFVTQRAIGKLGENKRARAGAGNEAGI